MVIQKSARGVVVAIYDDAGYIITAQDGAAISAIASMWHRMLHPPENLLTEPPAIFVKHKKPDIYK
jgi:hypothetical protein